MRKTMTGLVVGGVSLAASSALAVGTGVLAVAVPVNLAPGTLLSCCVYAILATLLLILCFKIFDKVMTKIDLEAEVLKGNIAAGIFSAAVLIAIALIIAAAIS